MYSRIFAALLVLLPFAATYAQTTTGRVVVRSTAAPLAQTTVRLAGQASGTSTDEAGRFQLVLPANAGSDARLVFSHLGYESQTVPVKQLGPEVQLEEMLYQIGEVVVRYESLRKLLLREWKIEESSLDAAGQQLLAEAQLQHPAQAAKLAAKPDVVRAVLKMAHYTFKPNGAIKATVLLFGSKGRWQLDEAQRTLLITSPEGREAAMVVTELTAERLVLHDPATNLPDIVYVPVK